LTGTAEATGCAAGSAAALAVTPRRRFARSDDKSRTSKHKTTRPPISNGNQFKVTQSL
jgi:hypothetical protein